MELTIEQKRAIAVARARQAQAAAQAAPVEAPEPAPDMLAADDQARIAEAPVTARLVSAAKGLPFVGSWLDEARGAIRGPEEGEALRQMEGAMERQHPGQDAALGLAGGIAGTIGTLGAGKAVLPAALGKAATALGPSLLGRTVASLGLGALGGGFEGSVYGAGLGGDRVGHAATGAAIGGATGGLLGAAMPAVGDGVASIARALTNRPSAAAAKAAGLSPSSTEALLSALGADDALNGAGRQRIAAAGPGAMLADAGESAQSLLDTAMQRSGPGAQAARDAIESRATQAGGQVRSALENLAPGGQVATKGTPMRELYDAAYSAPVDYSSDAGRQIEGLLPRVPQEIISRANRLIQMDTDAINPKQIMLGADGKFTELPNVLQLDYVTRALQDVARAGDGQGALGGSTNEGRVYGKLARQIRTAVRETVPEYGKALDTAATEIGARNAQEYGRSVMRSTTTRADLADELAGMGKAEAEHLRIGIRQGVEETLDNVKRSVSDGNVDARQATQAIKDFSSDAAREKLRMVFGDKEAAGFVSQLEEAARALELRAGVATNSRTFARQEADRTIKSRLNDGPVEAAMRGEPVNMAKNIAQALTGRTAAGTAKREQDVYAEIARILTESRGGDAISTMQMLEALGVSRPLNAARASSIGQGVAGAAALPAYLQARQSQ
jgi:hypothetical protein